MSTNVESFINVESVQNEILDEEYIFQEDVEEDNSLVNQEQNAEEQQKEYTNMIWDVFNELIEYSMDNGLPLFEQLTISKVEKFLSSP